MRQREVIGLKTGKESSPPTIEKNKKNIPYIAEKNILTPANFNDMGTEVLDPKQSFGWGTGVEGCQIEYEFDYLSADEYN